MRLGPTAGGKTRAELLSAAGALHGWHWLDTAVLAGLLKERGLPADAHEGRRFAVGSGAAVAAAGDNPPPDDAPAGEPIEWDGIALHEFLAGDMPWLETVTVTAVEIDGYVGGGVVRLELRRADGRGPLVGEMPTDEARATLARFALPLKAGETLRPVADAGGPTEAPGLWRDTDLTRFLAGEMSGVESLTVLKIDEGGDVGGGGPQASVTFHVDRNDGLPSQTGKMALYEAQSELAEVGLSLKVGGTLRPLPGGLGGGARGPRRRFGPAGAGAASAAIGGGFGTSARGRGVPRRPR